MSTKMDTTSVCSSIPSSSNMGPKKRGFSRLSFRRLFYANPFLNQQRLSRCKRATTTAGPAVAEAENNANPTPLADCEITSLSSQSQLKVGVCELMECPLCLSELPMNCFPRISSCPHRSCYDCLRQYLRIEITESRVNISCPECTEPLHPNDLRLILNNENLMDKYEDFMLRRVLVSEPDARWCPAPDCSFAVIASGCASCPKLKCERPGCNTYFCYHCKQEWHPNQTCDAARAQRSPNVRSSSISFSQDSAIQSRTGDDIKSCPRCQILIVKMDDGSCNHMTCAVCGAEFCWLCMKEISDLHYLSPSGCTFWGKKPWSRKKKILWQLGTLVGAPVGIGLVAGIAVPAMIIGIPVWVGRKIHSRFENSSKHKRNLAITGGVTASILVSPILAGLAVGIGVPILLAYVYGVVPISLCRSGGCGVTTSASGVRIDFDDETDLSVGASSHVPDAQSVDMSNHRVANPSIGEVSFGMSASLSMGSGSHMERIGLIRDSDRESASNTAIAGASLTGSIISSMTGATAGHRLEVQADVSSNKRFSFSSETASMTVSLSERSGTFSVADDASTKALAGSVLGYRDRDGSSTSCTPVEVHIDPSTQTLCLREEIYLQNRGDELNDGNNGTVFNHYGEAKYRHGKHVNLSIKEDDYRSLSAGDDSVSEKVRFDENVSFIDDPPTDEVWIGIPEMTCNREVASKSLNGGGEGGHSQFVVNAEGVDEVSLPIVMGKNSRPTCSSLKNTLTSKQCCGGESASNYSCLTPPGENLLPGVCVPDLKEVRISLPSQMDDSDPTKDYRSSNCSKMSQSMDSDLNCHNSATWASRQSLPCISMKEATVHVVRTESKRV